MNCPFCKRERIEHERVAQCEYCMVKWVYGGDMWVWVYEQGEGWGWIRLQEGIMKVVEGYV